MGFSAGDVDGELTRGGMWACGPDRGDDAHCDAFESSGQDIYDVNWEEHGASLWIDMESWCFVKVRLALLISIYLSRLWNVGIGDNES